MVVLLQGLLLASLALVAAAKSAVIDLTSLNFDKVVLTSGKPTLVEFFAPWCGHCKTLAPVYEELAQALESAKDRVQIAKVDADAEKVLGKRFGIQGFPTLKWFDGKSADPVEYSSGRDLKSLTAFITKKTGVKPKRKLVPVSSVVMLDDSSFKTHIGGEKNVLVAYTTEWCGHCKKLAPIYEDVAADFANDDDVVIIAKLNAENVSSKATAKAEDVSSYPTIKWYPKGSTEGELYEGGRTHEDFIEFINAQAGLHRTPGGGLDENAGRVASLDQIMAKLMGGTAMVEVAASVTEHVAALTDTMQRKYADTYVKVFDKLAKSQDYVTKEIARLDGILAKGGLVSKKRDELQTKLNVLKQFVNEVVKTAETKDSIKEEL